MSERILTLFGEELFPEQPKPAPKPRAKKAPKEKEEEETETKEEPVEAEAPVAKKAKKEEPKEPEAPKVKEKAPVAIEAEAEVEEEEETVPEKKPGKTKAEIVNLPDDWEGEKQYYSIGEVAALFKVKTSHIRFWTNEFKLKVRTTRKGDRLFTPEQIKELRAIHHLVKERGFTLNGAKAKMKTQNKRDVETIDLKQSLQQLRGKLLAIRNQLT